MVANKHCAYKKQRDGTKLNQGEACLRIIDDTKQSELSLQNLFFKPESESGCSIKVKLAACLHLPKRKQIASLYHDQRT